jgi:hypothetical protein
MDQIVLNKIYNQCPEHDEHVIDPTYQRDNTVTNSNDDSNFEDVLNQVKVNRELQKSYQVKDQN